MGSSDTRVAIFDSHQPLLHFQSGLVSLLGREYAGLIHNLDLLKASDMSQRKSVDLIPTRSASEAETAEFLAGASG